MKKLLILAVVLMLVIGTLAVILSQTSIRESDDTISRVDRKIEEAMRK